MSAAFFQIVQKKISVRGRGGGVGVRRERESKCSKLSIWGILAERDAEIICTIFATSLGIRKYLKLKN